MPGTGKTQLAIQLSVLTRLNKSLGGVQGQTLYIDTEGNFIPERVYDMAKALQEHVAGTAVRRRKMAQQQQQQQQQLVMNNMMLEDAKQLTADNILKSIQVYRVHDETALLATLYSLKDYIEQQYNNKQVKEVEEDNNDCQNRQNEQHQPSSSTSTTTTATATATTTDTKSLPVKLIIIDSIAFHFRAITPTDSLYYIQRTKTLTRLATYLSEIATKYNIAIVTINHMTTKILNNNHGMRSTTISSSSTLSNSSSIVVPALGESWAHATSTRILLSSSSTREQFKEVAGATNDNDNDSDNNDEQDNYNNNQTNNHNNLRDKYERMFTLVKSSHRPSGTVKFKIINAGIRDVQYNYTNHDTNNSNKRVRHGQ